MFHVLLHVLLGYVHLVVTLWNGENDTWLLAVALVLGTVFVLVGVLGAVFALWDSRY